MTITKERGLYNFQDDNKPMVYFTYFWVNDAAVYLILDTNSQIYWVLEMTEKQKVMT